MNKKVYSLVEDCVFTTPQTHTHAVQQQQQWESCDCHRKKEDLYKATSPGSLCWYRQWHGFLSVAMGPAACQPTHTSGSFCVCAHVFVHTCMRVCLCEVHVQPNLVLCTSCWNMLDLKRKRKKKRRFSPSLMCESFFFSFYNCYYSWQRWKGKKFSFLRIKTEGIFLKYILNIYCKREQTNLQHATVLKG